MAEEKKERKFLGREIDELIALAGTAWALYRTFVGHKPGAANALSDGKSSEKPEKSVSVGMFTREDDAVFFAIITTLEPEVRAIWLDVAEELNTQGKLDGLYELLVKMPNKGEDKIEYRVKFLTQLVNLYYPAPTRGIGFSAVVQPAALQKRDQARMFIKELERRGILLPSLYERAKKATTATLKRQHVDKIKLLLSAVDRAAVRRTNVPVLTDVIHDGNIGRWQQLAARGVQFKLWFARNTRWITH